MKADARKRQIIQIKAASRTVFGDDDDAARDCYESITGRRSCREMTDAQLRQVGDYLAKASGHKPDRPISLRPNSSSDLARVLSDFAAKAPPRGWRLNPLQTTIPWKHIGLDHPVPFAHLDRDQQDRLHRWCRAAWGRRRASA